MFTIQYMYITIQCERSCTPPLIEAYHEGVIFAAKQFSYESAIEHCEGLQQIAGQSLE